MSGEDLQLEEFQGDFLDEMTFLLADCEESYLKLEDPTKRKEELAKIFRLAHSMKGAGAAVGFTDLSSFAHVVEDCLAILRVCPEKVNSNIISTLLLCGDAFKTRVAMLKMKDPSPWDNSQLMHELQKTIDQLRTGIGGEGEGTVAKVSATHQPIVVATSEKTNAHHPVSSSSIKIDSNVVESFLNSIGELVVIKSQVLNQCAKYPTDIRLSSIVSQLDKTIREVQEKTLGMRMTPLKSLFLKTQRVIRDLSVKFGKPINFHMTGEDTEVDRSLVELLADPLMHIARNSLDHGIEPSDTRIKNNKNPIGNIYISAKQVGDRVLIIIKDDGGGINREKVFQKGVEKGLIAKDQDLTRTSDQQIFQLIFEPGFSTASVVTDVSGRGVGMDVVKSNVEKMKGTVEIASKLKEGTSISLSIPLTTSITDGMIIRAGRSYYIIPMDNIRELINIKGNELIEIEAGGRAINHREQIYPVLNLVEAFERNYSGKIEPAKMYVLVDSGKSKIVIGVNEVIGQTQVVLKILGSNFKEVKGVSGAAILGDGRVALVVNPHGLNELITSMNVNRNSQSVGMVEAV